MANYTIIIIQNQYVDLMAGCNQPKIYYIYDQILWLITDFMAGYNAYSRILWPNFMVNYKFCGWI